MNESTATTLDHHDAIRRILRGEHKQFSQPPMSEHCNLEVYLPARNLQLAKEYGCDPLPDIEIQQILDPAGLPILPTETRVGLRDVLALARWEASYNDISSGWVEWKRAGEDDSAWSRDSREQRAVVMTECSEAARCERHKRIVPWSIAGARAEDRLVLALAQRHRRKGQPDEDYIRVAGWILEHGYNQRMGLFEVLKAADVLHKYEGRAPRDVQQAARKCMQAHGWKWKPARRPGRSCPCLSWCSPDV